jgi:deazaflavin-dependent oxidoreductase (nitroreductase family)
MPGDDVVPGCQYRCTRAITVHAPPSVVWPWLVQVGFGKAGFYSNDLLDNVAHPSADRILDEFQNPAVGDWVPMFSKVNDTTAFKIVAIEPCAELLWAKPDSTWAWKLSAVEGGTRLVTRLRILYDWTHPLGAATSLVLNEVGDFPMMRRMLLTLKERAERARPSEPARWAAKPLLGLRRQPGRLALALMRMPRPLYHHGWGWILGHTFLLIAHQGRNTGKRRETVAMALAYDRDTREAIVCSAWGPSTEWIRNLRAHTALEIRIGRASYVPQHRFLSEDESVAVVAEFRRRHAGRARLFATILGWGRLSSEAEMREFVRTRPFVSFYPARAEEPS